MTCAESESGCGHTGLGGSAIVRRLKSEGWDLLTADRRVIGLKRQGDVEAWVKAMRPAW